VKTFLRDLPIAGKLAAGFGLVLILMLAIAVVGLKAIGSVGEDAEYLGTHTLPGVGAIRSVDAASMDYRGTQFALLSEPDAADREPLVRHLGEASADVSAAFKAYRPLIADDIDRRSFDKVAAAWKTYLDATSGVTALARAGRTTEAIALLNRSEEGYASMQSSIDAWAADATADAGTSLEKARDTHAHGRVQLIVLALIAAALAVAVALLVSRQIKRGVTLILDRLQVLRDQDTRALKQALESMAAGDLTRDVETAAAPIDLPSRDEIGRVAGAVDGIRESTAESVEAYNAMREQLAGVIGHVTRNAATVAAASQQMASTSDEAGRAVGEIASAVGEVAMGAERQVRMVESARATVRTPPRPRS
jgi:methyl-accepting chemotaxis protein